MNVTDSDRRSWSLYTVGQLVHSLSGLLLLGRRLQNLEIREKCMTVVFQWIPYICECLQPWNLTALLILIRSFSWWGSFVWLMKWNVSWPFSNEVYSLRHFILLIIILPPSLSSHPHPHPLPRTCRVISCPGCRSINNTRREIVQAYFPAGSWLLVK